MLAKSRRKLSSASTRLRNNSRKMLRKGKSGLVRTCASFSNMVGDSAKTEVEVIDLRQRSDAEKLQIRVVGLVGDDGVPEDLDNGIRSAFGSPRYADVRLAPVLLGSQYSNQAILSCLDEHGVIHPKGNKAIESVLVNCEIGSIGIVFYSRYFEEAKRIHPRIELCRHIQLLNKRNATFVLVCVINDRMRKISSREKRLYGALVQLGADYVVGVTPNVVDSGKTYLSNGRSVRHSVYSLGTCLSSSRTAPYISVALNLCLGTENGRIELIQESFTPLLHKDNGGFDELRFGDSESLECAEALMLSSVMQRFKRIHCDGDVLTLGRIMEVTNTPVPKRYHHLMEHSVGRVCARSFEVQPGDVFFFREAFNDPNDLEVPSESQREKIVARAIRRGALAVISYKMIDGPCPCFINGNVVEAHIAMSAYLRRRLPTRFVAITGSVGKTSTKDMLFEVLRMQYRTKKSEHNSNVQVHIGQHVQDILPSCEMFLQEVGGGRPGGASRHSRMILPQAAVITNIGDAHIGNFYGSQEALMENKLHIVDGMKGDGGVLFLNDDDPLLHNATAPCKIVRFAVHSRAADFFADEIESDEEFTYFNVVHNGEKTPVKLRVFGEHNVLNAVCAFAIGRYFGMSDALIVEGLSHFKTQGIRQNIYYVSGRHLLMDCYNASSKSMRSSLDILNKIAISEGNKRIAVLGDITGMGDLSKEIHENLAETLATAPPQVILLFGKEVAYTHEILESKGIDSLLFDSRDALNDAIEQYAEPGDAILFKGSSKMLLEYSADMVFGTRFTDQRFLDEKKYRRVIRHSVGYNVFENHASAVAFSKKKTGIVVRIVSKIGSVETTAVSRAFKGSNVKEVSIPDSVLHLSSSAFENCANLETIRLSRKLKFISPRAFANCSALETIDLPNGLLHIGESAFLNCAMLQTLSIPRTVVQIGDSAFEGCANLVLRCYEDTYASEYAECHNIPFELIR